MKTKTIEMKDFDSVKMMRDTQDKLIDNYINNPHQEIKDLKAVQKKYILTTSNKISAL